MTYRTTLACAAVGVIPPLVIEPLWTALVVSALAALAITLLMAEGEAR